MVLRGALVSLSLLMIVLAAPGAMAGPAAAGCKIVYAESPVLVEEIAPDLPREVPREVASPYRSFLQTEPCRTGYGMEQVAQRRAWIECMAADRDVQGVTGESAVDCSLVGQAMYGSEVALRDACRDAANNPYAPQPIDCEA